MASSAPEHMNANRRLMLVLVLCALTGLALLVGGLLLVERGDNSLASQGGYRGSEPPGRIRLPGFELLSYRGERVVASALVGKVVLLTLLDTQCTEACPILASAVGRAVDKLSPGERAQVRALAVTGDPAEDTPASVRRFLGANHAQGRLDYLIGTEPELRPLWEALHVLPSLDSGRDSLHSAPLRIYDRAGVWVATLHAGADLNEANLLHDIRQALRASGDER